MAEKIESKKGYVNRREPKKKEITPKDASKFKNVSIGVCYLMMALLIFAFLVLVPLLYGDINGFLDSVREEISNFGNSNRIYIPLLVSKLKFI